MFEKKYLCCYPWLSNLSENPYNRNYYYVVKYKYLTVG